MKDKYETIHDPGHSSRLSTGTALVVVCGAGVVVRGVGGGALVLSQHTLPRLQLDVCGTKTDGRSQKAAIILNKQKPGQRGAGGYL